MLKIIFFLSLIFAFADVPFGEKEDKEIIHFLEVNGMNETFEKSDAIKLTKFLKWVKK